MNWLTNLLQQKKKRIYLDYAAATPVLKEVRQEMEKYFSQEFYNPNAIYEEGVRIKKEVDEYRARIAKILGAAKEGVIFTSGGTEANALAVRGVRPGRIIVEKGSHPSVSEAARGIRGAKTTLVSSVTTDNKLGRNMREERKKNNSEYPLLHIDASQTVQYFPVGLEILACDLLTIDSAKLYGPKGIGALVVRRTVKLELPPFGTPAVPLIAGIARALELAVRDREAEYKRLDSLSSRFVEDISRSLPQAQVAKLPPNIVNVSIPGILPELIALALDRQGVLVSVGTACSLDTPEPEESAVRFSFGKFTTENDMKNAAEIFCRVCLNMIK